MLRDELPESSQSIALQDYLPVANDPEDDEYPLTFKASLFKFILCFIMGIGVITFHFAVPRYFDNWALQVAYFALFTMFLCGLFYYLYKMAEFKLAPAFVRGTEARFRMLYIRLKNLKPHKNLWTVVWPMVWMLPSIIVPISFLSSDRTATQINFIDFLDGLILVLGVYSLLTFVLFLIGGFIKFVRIFTYNVPSLWLSAILAGLVGSVLIPTLTGVSFESYRVLLCFFGVNILMCLLGFFGWTIFYFRKRRLYTFFSVIGILVCLGAISVPFTAVYGPGFNIDNIKTTLPWDHGKINATNPGLNGNYAYSQVYYGSGAINKNKPHYIDVDRNFLTPIVNGDFLVDKFPKDVVRFFGFNDTQLPLNGIAFIPKGDGPFPLFIMVHGNHNFVGSSEDGLIWLGQFLASRGFIYATIDENFLNSWVEGEEMPLRAWLIMKHLQQFRTWNQTPGHPLFNKVNLTSITLGGHSEGAEAIAIAWNYNQMRAPMYNAVMKFDNFDFGIVGLVSISSGTKYIDYIRGLWKLEDVNIICMQGAYDADQFLYEGFRHYEAMKFTDNSKFNIKAGVYIGHANHAQFNTNWGQYDILGLPAWFLSTSALLSGEEQRTVTKVFVSSFLEATHRNNYVYLPILEEYRAASPEWLPHTQYSNQYITSKFILIANFEGSNDIFSLSIKGGICLAENIDSWGLGAVSMRHFTEIPDVYYNTASLSLKWNTPKSVEKPAILTLFINGTSVSNKTLNLTEQSSLTFTVAVDPTAIEVNPNAIKLFRIYMNDTSNRTSYIDSLPIDPPLPTKLFKYNINSLSRWYGGTSTQSVFRTYNILFSEFSKSQIDWTDLATIQFEWHGEPSFIYLDDIGFYI